MIQSKSLNPARLKLLREGFAFDSERDCLAAKDLLQHIAYLENNFEIVQNRLAINCRILSEEVFPRIAKDLPKPRSDKQRAAYRVTLNYASELIEGNVKLLKHLIKQFGVTEWVKNYRKLQ